MSLGSLGSYERDECAAGVMIQVITKTLGWVTIDKKNADQYLAGIPSMLNLVAVLG